LAAKKLPLIALADKAIKLPFIHWREFIRFATILIAVDVTSSLVSIWTGGDNFALAGENQAAPLWSMLLELVLFIALAAALIPFAVAWIRLTVNGAPSVSRRPIWTFGRVERQFTLGGLVLGLIVAVPFLIVFGIAMLVRSNTGLMAALIVLAAASLAASWACVVRLSFITVELALQRYRGPQNSWAQTQGNFWRIVGLELLVLFPFSIGYLVGQAIIWGLRNQPVLLVLAAILQTVLTLAWRAASAGALALAYQFTTPEPSEAAVATS
jgi:hypothetical protein